MATYSTGISVTWDGTAFSEVTDLTWSYGGSIPKGRSVLWSDDIGAVSLTCLGIANVSSAQYGKRSTLTISGGGATLTTLAVYEGFSVTPEVNGVTRYSVTFKILDG